MAIKSHIPNTITCCNLVSGSIATYFAVVGNMELSFFWIIAGAVFDFFDGMSARLLGVSSPIGKELDSLADVITFGLAPSAMVFSLTGVMEYPAFLEPVGYFIPFFAFVMAAFSALRLAKFNLDERQTTSFIGLPTPANALFWADSWRRRVVCLISLDDIRHPCRHLPCELASHCRDSHVRLEVQTLGMGRKRGEIYLHHHLHTFAFDIPCCGLCRDNSVVCVAFRICEP